MTFPLSRFTWRGVVTSGLILIGMVIASVKGLEAWNSRMTPARIAAGENLFRHEWQVNDPLSGKGDGLGPVFNGRSCVECHFQGGIGGSSGNQFNVTAFDVRPDDNNRFHRSGVVHSSATAAGYEEDRQSVQDLFPVITRILKITERAAYGGNMHGCAPAGPPRERELVVDENPVTFHELNSPALFGVGLIDELSNISISMHGTGRLAAKLGDELNGKFGGNGIGMTRISQGGLGKFGWKGQFSSLEDFVASACAMELGLTNPLQQQPVPRKYEADPQARMDMTRRQLRELVCFVRSLPQPVQVLPADPEARQRVIYGEKLFVQIGCTDCHVRDIGHLSGVYSDFHLYNLEDSGAHAARYGDDPQEQPIFDFDRNTPDKDQWQTPPLWGVADSAPYFHDGRSSTLERAILRHKGQANYSRTGYQNLGVEEQDCIIEFLKTLRAPGHHNSSTLADENVGQ